MSRYIDADALKEYIGSVRAEFNFFDDDERARYEAHSKAIYLLDLYVSDAPSIDIVRCQDCKYWVYNFNGCSRNPCTEPWYATDFCNYGEREGE